MIQCGFGMAEGTEGADEVGTWQVKMRGVLGRQSKGLSEAKTKLAAAYRGFQKAAADELKPVINAQLSLLASASDEAKKQVIDDIRELLTSLNLAILCPATKQPAMLYAIAPNNRNKHVQFWVKPKNAKSTTFTTVDINEIMPIELVESQSRQEGFSLWHQKVKGGQGKPPQRS